MHDVLLRNSRVAVLEDAEQRSHLGANGHLARSSFLGSAGSLPAVFGRLAARAPRNLCAMLNSKQ
jgi:hypothetical protein